MSQWRMTRYDSCLNREITSIILMPDVEEHEQLPIEAVLLLADEAHEAEWFPLRTAVEVTLCKQQHKAAVCLPGWVLNDPNALTYVTQQLPAMYSALFPIHLATLWGEGRAQAWIEGHWQQLGTVYTMDDVLPEWVR